MSEAVCLDGVKLELDVDRVDVDLKIPGLATAAIDCAAWEQCDDGETMAPIATYDDGTVIYFHCAPEGEPVAPGYRVASSRPHEWAIELSEASEGSPSRVARIHVRLV